MQEERSFVHSAQLRKALLDKRNAFWMGKHPRLGADSIIQRLPKDIVRLIATEYITLKSQCDREYDRHDARTPLRARDIPRLHIEFTAPKITARNDMSMHYLDGFIDRTLLIQHQTRFAIQLPELPLMFDVKAPEEGYDRSANSNICLNLSWDGGEEVIKAVESVEAFAMRIAEDTFERNGQFIDTDWHTSIKRDASGRYPPMFRVVPKGTDFEAIRVFNRETRRDCGALADNYENLRRGAHVTLIIGRPSLWVSRSMGAGLTWKVLQLAYRPKQQEKLDCLFVDTGEDE